MTGHILQSKSTIRKSDTDSNSVSQTPVNRRRPYSFLSTVSCWRTLSWSPISCIIPNRIHVYGLCSFVLSLIKREVTDYTIWPRLIFYRGEDGYLSFNKFFIRLETIGTSCRRETSTFQVTVAKIFFDMEYHISHYQVTVGEGQSRVKLSRLFKLQYDGTSDRITNLHVSCGKSKPNSGLRW